MHLDIFILSTIIDAFEKRDVATADVKEAYLHTTMNEFAVVKLTDEQVEIMCKIDGICNRYVTYDKGRKVMYLMFNSGLYRILQGALLWYRLLTSKLKSFCAYRTTKS